MGYAGSEGGVSIKDSQDLPCALLALLLVPHPERLPCKCYCARQELDQPRLRNQSLSLCLLASGPAKYIRPVRMFCLSIGQKACCTTNWTAGVLRDLDTGWLLRFVVEVSSSGWRHILLAIVRAASPSGHCAFIENSLSRVCELAYRLALGLVTK